MDLTDAFELARQALVQHGLADWSAEFDNAKRWAGVCRYSRRIFGLSVNGQRDFPVGGQLISLLADT